MGLFDKMFGREATKAQAAPDANMKFNTLRNRFAPALAVVEREKVRLLNLHVQDGKLFVRGVAPSEDAKSKVMESIRSLDAEQSAITAEISVSAQPAGAGAAGSKSYTVKGGDTLSKIAKEHYGDSNEYMRIFYANPDKLKDPDKIQVGQVLVVPPDTDA